MTQVHKAKTFDLRRFQKNIMDLQSTHVAPGLVKFGVLIASVIFLFSLAFMQTHGALTFLFLILGGLAYGSLLITTHDALHHTLTGIKWVDEVLPRLISYPAYWPHGVYSSVHRIHHRMNGIDFDDPERVQWTVDEYKQASPLVRFYVRHQWFLNIFVFAGIGMIVKTYYAAYRFYGTSRELRRNVWIDVVCTNFFIFTLYHFLSVYMPGNQAWMVFLAVERISGGMMQFRAHVEHYGLWGEKENYFENQITSCRNITTSNFVSWYFNRLNFHTIHHMFPKVPFYNLPVAHGRLREYLVGEGFEDLQIVQDSSYMQTALRLASSPSLLADDKQAYPVDEIS